MSARFFLAFINRLFTINIFYGIIWKKGLLGECVPGRMPTPMHRVRGSPFIITKEDIDMDTNGIMQLIGSLGFPIVACGALFWMLNKQNEMHREETNTLKEAIDELKVAILQLTNYINIDKNKQQ